MKACRRLMVLLLLGVLVMLAGAQVAPPNTGKLSWGLFEAASEMLQRGDRGEQVVSISALLVSADEATDADVAEMKDRGYVVEAGFGHFTLVRAPGNLYLDRERGIDTLDFVVAAGVPPASILNAHQTTGSATIGAEAAHAAGYAGAGTTVAVIEEGFNHNDPLLQSAGSFHLVVPDASQDSGYTVDTGQVARVDCHGTACATIVADIAPEATLLLISYPGYWSIIGWLCALHYAVAVLGADIVTTSMEFALPTCHADGSGELNADVVSILSASETTLVIPSGNWALGGANGRAFYAGRFDDADSDGQHDFTPDASTTWDRNTLRFSGRSGDVVEIIMEWDDWDRDVGVEDLDLILSIDGYEDQVSASRGTQYGTTNTPVEIIRYELPWTADYCLSVENNASTQYGEPTRPVSMHIYIRNLTTECIAFVEHHSTDGSIREVATSPHVLTVGAISVEDRSLLPYSSRGPTYDGRTDKPEICAPSGVAGTCYRVFDGTSASVPCVAGALSVLQSADQALSAEDAVKLLLGSSSSFTDHQGSRIRVIDLGSALGLSGDAP